jgi:hypothetical protein
MGLQEPSGEPYFRVSELFTTPAPPKPEPAPYTGDWEITQHDDSVPASAVVLEPSIASHQARAGGGSGLAVMDGRFVVRVVVRGAEIELSDPAGTQRRVITPRMLVHPSRFAVLPRVPVELAHQLGPRTHVVLYTEGAGFDLTWSRAAVEAAGALSLSRPPRVVLHGGTRADLHNLFTPV